MLVLEVACGLVMQFVVDDLEELFLGLLIAIAPIPE
jgi:hypothetical protein